MKKFLGVILFLFLLLPVSAETLRGSTSFDEQLKGFFGVWHVSSKIENATNYSMFNKLSVDIWNLSGSGNVLILENALTGATSSINVDLENSLDGKTLTFKRVKEFKTENYKFKHTEVPRIVLNGNIFKGSDTFTVEKFDLKNNLISKDVVKYKIIGQKIAGDK